VIALKVVPYIYCCQWNDVVEEIPSSGHNVEIDDFLPEEDNEASQTFEELFNGNDSLGPDDSFFDALGESDDYFAPTFP
jgi:hypothetical protein